MAEKLPSEKDNEIVENPSIAPRLIEEEMKQSYLDYSMSVIVGRALPDVRDGLKPVHRRILYAMFRAGLLSNKPFRKSAFIVGRTMAEYHPHGDSAIYDTLVRLAQDFSLRYPLVRGQGNFGSIDGDNPAAQRYTEAKLQKLAEELLQDIDKSTVKFTPNFDNTSKEPSVLPAKIPNLLVNGSSGIAVGMATNIPPHNLSEVAHGVITRIDNPECELKDVMEHIKGPDFPTGATICGQNGIMQAYKTGRGKVILKAKAEITEVKDRQAIIVTEIPYMVNKAEMIKNIADAVRDKKIQGIHDIRDESDKDGIRIVFELKKDANPQVTLNQLYMQSRLKTTFGVALVALVDNIPKQLSLIEIIDHFIDHRKNIIRKRTLFDLNKAQNRAHILEGLIIALDDIDKTVDLIKQSKDVEEAKQALITAFKLSDEQTSAILEMRLQRLTSLETGKIKEEHKELLKLIEKLKEILNSPQMILDIIKDELKNLVDTYGDERRSFIDLNEEEDIDIEDIIEEGQCVVTITHSGYVKRQSVDVYRQQNRGGKGIIGTTTKEEDSVQAIFTAHTHSYLLLFTSKGKVHWLKCYQIPDASRQARGTAIVNLVQLDQDEQVTAYIPVKTFDKDHYVVMGTQLGTIKKVDLTNFAKPRRGGIIAMGLDPADKLIGVAITDGDKQIMIATKQGMAVRFHESNVRPMGRTAQGVRGIKLQQNDAVVNMVVVSEDQAILTGTENGYGKRTAVSEYRLIQRGGSGVRNIICSERNGPVVAAVVVDETDEIMLISQKGITIRTAVNQISVIGRNTQGVRIMKLGDGDKMVSIAKIAKDDAAEEQ